MEKAKEAIEDANKALTLRPNNIKAVLVKGEALYKMGKFENALVQFHRGWKARADPEIKLGIARCTEEIVNSLSNPCFTIDLLPCKGRSIINNIKPSSQAKSGRKSKCDGRNKKGKMNTDRINEDIDFLKRFIEFENMQPKKSANMVYYNFFT